MLDKLTTNLVKARSRPGQRATQGSRIPVFASLRADYELQSMRRPTRLKETSPSSTEAEHFWAYWEP